MSSENDVKLCSNCKREIPGGNYLMHVAHCQRKLSLCPKCDEPIPHSEMEMHNQEEHVAITCQDCGECLEKNCLSEHKARLCSRRQVCCSYCHIETLANELIDHENYCGSRTERCEDCGEFVMLKYKLLHEDSNHGFLKLEDEPGPTPSWCNTQNATSVLNDLSRHRKVSNASHDTIRPTSTSNKLSPSKRTNDMPQVNSVLSAVKVKPMHKTTIPQDDSSVDLDRLLALRIAQQEQSLFSSPTAPPESDLQDFMYDSTDCGELVALPCEFCEAMIPANQLVLHETGCQPELTRYCPPSTASVPKIRKGPDPQEDGLPCEFCGSLFPPHVLLQHQDICENSHIPLDRVHFNQLSPVRSRNLTSKNQVVNCSPKKLFPSPSQNFSLRGCDNDVEYRSTSRKSSLGACSPPERVHNPISEVNMSNAVTSSSQSSKPSGIVNGYLQQSGSTGAVPKQKAGKHLGIRQVPQEIQSSSSATVTRRSNLKPNNDASR